MKPHFASPRKFPVYWTDGQRVLLRIFDGGFDERMATLVAKWDDEGRKLILTDYWSYHSSRRTFIDTLSASDLLQLARSEARAVLGKLSHTNGILERERDRRSPRHTIGRVAKDLLGKASYTKVRALDPVRYQEMVKAFLEVHNTRESVKAR